MLLGHIKKISVAVVATHPIQYHVPWFRALAHRPEVALEVWYLGLPNAVQQGTGFGVAFSWDIPMLDGYRWRYLKGDLPRQDLRRGFSDTSLEDLTRLLDDERPEVLLLTGWQSWPLIQFARAARRLRIPCLVRGDSNAMKPRPLAVRLWHRWLLSNYDAFLYVGKANRDFYLRYGVPKERLFEVPHFVDNMRFEAAAKLLAPKREELRRRFCVPADAVCFLYAGKLAPKKHLMDMLEALALTRDAPGGKQMHVLVVGSGELMQKAQAFAATNRLPVSFAGFLNQSEMPCAYTAADCLVLPSDYGETWGLVVNEAMACGLPVIVSDRVGCGPDLVEPDVTGNIFPFGKVDALAALLARMAMHREDLQHMGKRAQVQVLGKYSVDRAVAGTLAAAQSVTKQR